MKKRKRKSACLICWRNRKRQFTLRGRLRAIRSTAQNFYEAQKKLEEGGFIVVNPALLPSEGFTWEAYMRMAGAMLNECAEVCFLPDWKESKGAQREFDEALCRKSRFSFSRNGRRSKMRKNNAPSLPIPTEAEEQIALSSGRSFKRGNFRNWRFCITFQTAEAGTRSKRHAFGRRA